MAFAREEVVTIEEKQDEKVPSTRGALIIDVVEGRLVETKVATLLVARVATSSSSRYLCSVLCSPLHQGY